MAFGLVVVLSGCSLLAPVAPDQVTWAVDSVVEETRSLDGVAAVSSKLSSVENEVAESSSHGDLWWSASITVDVEANLPVSSSESSSGATSSPGSLSTIATVIERILDDNPGVDADVTIQVPADRGGQAASLNFTGSEDCLELGTPAEMAEAATRIRGVDGLGVLGGASGPDTSAVFVTQQGPSARADVAEPTEVDEVVAQVRELPGFGTGPMTAVTIRSQASPEAPVTRKTIKGDQVVFPIEPDCTSGPT